MSEYNKLSECQKEFLFNGRYEITEWSFDKKLIKHSCNKLKISVYCDISDDININDLYDMKKQIIKEIISKCNSCKYHN